MTIKYCKKTCLLPPQTVVHHLLVLGQVQVQEQELELAQVLEQVQKWITCLLKCISHYMLGLFFSKL
jgi:hypothetical protein